MDRYPAPPTPISAASADWLTPTGRCTPPTRIVWGCCRALQPRPGIQQHQRVPAADAEIAPYTGRCPVCGGSASLVLGQPEFTSAALISPPAGQRHPPGGCHGRPGPGRGRYRQQPDSDLAFPAHRERAARRYGSGAAQFLHGRSQLSGSQHTAQSARRVDSNGKLYVSGCQNNASLFGTEFPQNNQPADMVLGQPNLSSAPPIDQTNTTLPTTASLMLSPVSVTSDGTHLFVADLGYNRVLIWNEIPTQNQQPADVEVGQLNFTNSIANDSTELCASNGTDSSGNPIYPAICAATMNSRATRLWTTFPPLYRRRRQRSCPGLQQNPYAECDPRRCDSRRARRVPVLYE